MEELEASPRAEQDVMKRALDVAESLREELANVAQKLTGDGLRPMRLVKRLGLDKSLASRIVRSLKTDAPFEFLHYVPSPAGLEIFLHAAGKGGVDTAIIKRARDRVAEFHDLLDSLPSGRAALDAMISHGLVDIRQRTERTAMQSVYRAMSYLLGFQCDVVTSAIILQPSENGQTVDGIDINRREGIYRLRPSAPVALFSVGLNVDSRQEAPRLERLRGDGHPANPESFLFREFCSPPEPPLELFESGSHTVVALSEKGAHLHEPVTISSGFIVRNGWVPYRTEQQVEDGRSYLLPYPCRLLIRDIYIRDDVYVGSEPQLRIEFPSPMGPAGPRMPGFPIRLNTLDLSAPVEHLGFGLKNAPAAGAPEHSRLLAHAFESAGWDPDRFRGYRTRIVYPVPMVAMGWWIPLPRSPQGV